MDYVWHLFVPQPNHKYQVKVEHHLNASDYYFVCSLHERASKKTATMCKIAYQQLFNERISAQGIRYR